MIVRSYRELEVYCLARKLAAEIFEISKKFPKDEAFSLTDQIRRSSRSVGAQIAEAWAKRRYEKHFISKLTDADGEQQETQHWLEVSMDCAYMTRDNGVALLEQYAKVGKMLHAMMSKSESFCGDPRR